MNVYSDGLLVVISLFSVLFIHPRLPCLFTDTRYHILFSTYNLTFNAHFIYVVS